MTEPILKSHWERFKPHVELSFDTITSLIRPYSTESIADIQWLSEGCANTNYKITFKSNRFPPVVLRLYTRDKSALLREIALHRWLMGKLPIPKPLYEDNSCLEFEHPYAIMAWMEGTMMRDVILSGDESAIYDCAFEAGYYLNQLRQMTFNQGGFFQADLTITPFDKSHQYQPFVLALLEDMIVKESLDDALHHLVMTWTNQHLKLLPNEQNANLVLICTRKGPFELHHKGPTKVAVQRTHPICGIKGPLELRIKGTI